MKLPADIMGHLDEDRKKLSEALIAGEISTGQGMALRDFLKEHEIEQLAGDILRFLLERRALSLFFTILGSMRWLELPLACLYARKSQNTLKAWIADPENPVYGLKTGDGVTSPIIVDRESIDKFYNEGRTSLEEEAINRLKEVGLL